LPAPPLLSHPRDAICVEHVGKLKRMKWVFHQSGSFPQIIIMSPMISGTMANISGLLFILLLVIAGFIMVSGCTAGDPPAVPATPTPASPTPVVTTAPASAQSCVTVDDCVPAECCHPTSCINKADKRACGAVACTMSCEGPIDCGAGRCGCVSGKCSVVASTPSPLPAVTRLP